MKTILGLDLGTNSIGWALINHDFASQKGKIIGMGSRIIPMSQDLLSDFNKAAPTKTQTALRTGFRSKRHLYERTMLRRERLHRVLNILGFLPEHYKNEIDFEKRLGQYIQGAEPKIAWKKNNLNKFEFVFPEIFDEMISDFRKNQPEMFIRKNRKGEDAKIPYDWAVYYLRKKALEKPLTKQQLAWLILNFNQKRGYYQLRGEDEDEGTKTEKTRTYFDTQIITEIIDTGEVFKGLKVLSIQLKNGESGKYFSKNIPDWVGVEKSIIVTVEIDKEGNDKIEENGSIKRKFTIPNEDDWDKKWKLIKVKTQKEIDLSGKTVGAYIYDSLLKKPNQKIRGKLVRTIERKYYRDELISILKKQIELQKNLFTEEAYIKCVRELYPSNKAHQIQLSNKGFIHLFVDDIIFYQRPLKSQKSSIGNCPLECRTLKNIDGTYKLNQDGKIISKIFKVIPKSNPYYQEFRVWQWLYNLKIIRKIDDKDVTSNFLNGANELVGLFDFLMSKKEVNHAEVLKYLFRDKKPKEQKEEAAKYRWNYAFDESKGKEEDKSKKFPMNETGFEIKKHLDKVHNVPPNFLSKEIEYHLWHIIYSVNDFKQYETALKSFIQGYNSKNNCLIDENSFIESFKKFKPFDSQFGSYSEKAIKKLLPLMRCGKHFDEYFIPKFVKTRAENIQIRLASINYDERKLAEIADDEIQKRVLSSFIKKKGHSFIQGLPLHLASFLVYERYSEPAFAGKWKTIQDLENYIKEFKQHSLRNPIVEQVISETLRVVRDIWQKFGKGAENYFQEIHIELGREMKNNAEDRKKITTQALENENTNLRIKALLLELKNDISVENVKPYSPKQQEILKIYEEGVLNSVKNREYHQKDLKQKEIDEEMQKIGKTAQPSKSELNRYKLWLEQKYKSPYTGQVIPLSKLFTDAYEIEHIIPQSRYFDDSFSNKVICETAVNQVKDKQLGLEFIKNFSGATIETGFGISVQILTESAYKDFVLEHYEKNRQKKMKLLLEEIPDSMIARQINDTRYISKFISSLLSNLVRSEINDHEFNSKNIIPGNGKITAILRQDWGLNDVWNDLILPRFERMNLLTNSNSFTTRNSNNKVIPTVPFELSKGFQKKRIDHRHHALDALVIACTTREHLNLMNNQHAKSENTRYDLQNKLRNKEKWYDKNGKSRDRFSDFKKPWIDFTQEAKEFLEEIVVSFKQNLRIINKTSNTYQKFENGKKVKVKQSGINWAIRKPLHKDIVSGLVKLHGVKLAKGKILTATRKSIDPSFDEKGLKYITDTGIQKILENFLRQKGSPEIAFSPEGLDELNKNISKYNNGKWHQPILKARIFELGGKFQLGQSGNKKNKYVEAAKGTNLFFAIYEDKAGKRSYDTIPLNLVIERQKQGLFPVPERNEKGDELCPACPYLSPNDLVYVPENEEKGHLDGIKMTKYSSSRIYKVVSFTGPQCFFIKAEIAVSISDKQEFSKLNKMERSIDGVMVKENCFKISVDRLGNLHPLLSTHELNLRKSNEPSRTYLSINSLEDLEQKDRINQASLSPEGRLMALNHLRRTTHSKEELNAQQKPQSEIKIRKQDENT